MNATNDIACILVVEDEVFVAYEIAELLTDLGFTVVGPALNADHAERLADEEDLDAAFLDVNLGAGTTTQATAEKLRAKGVPFIFITAYDADQITFRTSDERVLQKPVTDRKVLEALKTTLPDLQVSEGQ